MSKKQQLIANIELLPERVVGIFSLMAKEYIALCRKNEIDTAYNEIMSEYRPAYEELAKA